MGTRCHSNTGYIGVTPDKLGQLLGLSAQLLALGRATKRILQKTLGLYTSAWLVRRELQSVFHRGHAWVATLPEQGEVRLTPEFRDELFAAMT